MAGTISISGLGSGMDVDGIVSALVNASSTNKAQLQNRLSLTNSATSSVSNISTLLAKLKTSVDALATPEKAQSYAVSSSNSAVSASISTSTSAARYSVNVKALAQEYRAYSNPYSSLTDAMGATGQMSIKVGANDAVNIDVSDTDSLDALVSKINKAGAGVTASTLYDGTNYRLQLRGVNSGSDNQVTVTGLDLGLNTAGNVKQQAQDAHLVVDGYDVYSHTNVITGAIPGLSLTVSNTTDTAADVTIKADSSNMKTKIQSFVDAYNAVINTVHSVSGYGTTKASQELLAGNATLRSVTTTMSNTLRTQIDSGNSSYSTMYSLGIKSASDGTLTLDSTMLDKATSASPEAVTKIFAGTTSGDGVMDLMSSMVKTFTNSSNGYLTNQINTFKSNATRISTRIDSETDRLAKYEERLRAQFSNMDSIVSSANSSMSYLSSITGS